MSFCDSEIISKIERRRLDPPEYYEVEEVPEIEDYRENHFPECPQYKDIVNPCDCDNIEIAARKDFAANARRWV